MYPIEKNVPLPEVNKRSGGRKPVYPLKTMAIKDSFFVPYGNTPPVKVAKRLSVAIQAFKHRTGAKSRKYTYRSQDSGVRVWRIK